MEEAVAVVAVADKGMSAIISKTAVLHRASGGQLAIDQILPTVNGILDMSQAAGCVLIAEILDECLHHLLVVAEADLRGIFHIGRLCAIEHQRGHSLLLGFGTQHRFIRPFIFYNHIVPVEGRCRQGVEMNHLLLILMSCHILVFGNGLAGSLRPLVEVHDLRHRRSHTTCRARLPLQAGVGTVVKRYLVPIRSSLIPLCLDERLDGGLRRAGLQPVLAVTVGEVLALAERGDGLVVLLQPGLHILRHPLPVDGAAVRITQHGQGALVARGNHVAPTFAVKGIDLLSAHLGCRQSRRRQPTSLCRSLFIKILQGAIHRLLFCQLLRPHADCQQSQGNKK